MQWAGCGGYNSNPLGGGGRRVKNSKSSLDTWWASGSAGFHETLFLIYSWMNTHTTHNMNSLRRNGATPLQSKFDAYRIWVLKSAKECSSYNSIGTGSYRCGSGSGSYRVNELTGEVQRQREANKPSPHAPLTADSLIRKPLTAATSGLPLSWFQFS